MDFSKIWAGVMRPRRERLLGVGVGAEALRNIANTAAKQENK
jgi:hypothetical protein